MKLYLVSFFILISTVGFAQKSVKASFYHSKFEGRTTSSGTKYRADNLTCAHKTLPFGTRLRVENPVNNNFVVVEVTDRGPFIKGREIDLSFSAAKQIGIINQGVAQVNISKLPEVKFIPPIYFDREGLFLAEEAPHNPYGVYDKEKGMILYTQR